MTTSTRIDGPARARAALGFDRQGALVERELSVCLELDARGVERSVVQRTLWVAERDRAEGFPVIVVVPTPVTGRVVLEPVAGCSVGPDYTDLSDGVFAGTLVLDRPLRRGETARTEHRTHLTPDTTPEPRYLHRVHHPVERMEVAVRFHPSRLPSVCEAFTRDEDGEESWLLPVREGVARQLVEGFGPGEVGFRWEW